MIGARAAYLGPPPPPEQRRKQANRLAYRAEMAMVTRAADAEALARRAIEALVDAFLLSRRDNEVCFARAHRLGHAIVEEFGCGWSYDSDRGLFENECGVLALHSRIGVSYGGTVETACSICGAGDLECDHVPGEVYEGQRCSRRVVRWAADEISLTQDPADPRCFRVAELLDDARIKNRPDAELVAPGQARCTHCQVCQGILGPTAEDLDRSQWERASPQ